MGRLSNWIHYGVAILILLLGTSANAQIPSNITNALRAGGVNLVFGYYDIWGYKPNEFDDDLPVISSKGGRHVRLVIGMDIIENGTTGQLRSDRFQDIKNFVNKAKASGLVTIIDIHNSGLYALGDNSGTWSHDYMGNLRDAGVRSRHIRLLSELAKAVSNELDLNWIVLQPANEPIFDRGDHATWYNHQNQLIPAIRANCSSCVLFVVSHTWQAVSATIYNLEPRLIPWFDSKMIVDVHFYGPLALTHCAFTGSDPSGCLNKQWPAYYEDYLPSGNHYKGIWDKALLEREFKVLWDWRARNNNVPIHFSEIGTHSFLPDGPRSAYMGDLISVFQANGVGWSCFEWDKNFGMINHPKTIQACFKGGTSTVPVPQPTPTPEPTPTPTPTPTPGTLTFTTSTSNSATAAPGTTLQVRHSITSNQNLSGAIVQTIIYNLDNGWTSYASKAVPGVNLVAGAGSTVNLDIALPSTMKSGTYFISLEIFNSSWQKLHGVSASSVNVQTSAPTPTPEPTPTPTPEPTPTPTPTPTPGTAFTTSTTNVATIAPGATLAVLHKIVAAQSQSGLIVQTHLFNGQNGWTSYSSKHKTGVNLTAGVSASVQLDLALPSTLKAGEYQLTLEIFNSSWQKLYGITAGKVMVQSAANVPSRAALVSQLSGRCFDVAAESKSDGAKVMQYGCHYRNNQLFNLKAVSGGYQIIAVHSGKCLASNSTADGALVQQFTCGKQANQTFVLNRQTDGSYELKSALSGKCLDIQAESLADGAAVIQYSCHGRSNQRFKLEAR